MDAASRLLSAGRGLGVTDVLDGAGLSTRAFYRHFESKDALLLALFRRDSERVNAQLEAAIDAADTPRAALVAWIEGTLGLIADPRRRQRILAFGSEDVTRARGLAAERRRLQETRVAALIRIIAAGQADGSFGQAVLPGDARAIQAACSQAFDDQINQVAAVPAAEAAAEIADFALRALGALERTDRV
ncbi:transcriptional regulator, TetR family [Cryptosporangium aurantiacum]|uniref:Transcriptional regulator, TetR family n=2 Tax=Cryptosporangium aurantiacum TaxID=134849 RepID=A0A1M7R483_9ACTN|nr:transcriptional regulator, TetR family [Cryptosporangium aurantiacum]